LRYLGDHQHPQAQGGRYGISATATGAGPLGLQRLALDGSTWIPVHTAFTTGQNYTRSGPAGRQPPSPSPR
jgi:hypothetical protein